MSVVDGDRPFLVRLLPLLLCVSGLVTFFAVASTIPGEGGDVGGNGYGGYGPVGAL
ncbi:hypothetical protein ACIRBX_02345 [Kitasatospora sp. NPDC096147]|uniref:hypothetical protein n=1 Tax=Kitasatospora sp. NPDC096147 TaxID=3364093 RepID=UPI0037FF3763